MLYRLLQALLCLLIFALPATAAAPIEPKIAGMTKMTGFFPLYWDEANGKVWLEIPRLGEEFLYVVSLPAGLGSNDVGLDRGQLGEERIVRFERVGPKVLMVMPNQRFRATSTNPAERRAVREAFAESVLWGFAVAAESNGRILVDATDFVVRDGHGIVERLKRSKQGAFKLDPSRSAPYMESTKSFPDNTELEARLTFTSDEPGNYVRDVAADPGSLTLRVRYSLVRLPGPGFVPRSYDPRSGFITTHYVDYATPIGESIERRLITRHRLQKKDPSAALSEPVKPIVYYLDSGTPEPVRTALLEGGRWWAQAFEAAGFKNAFKVEMLPEGADPLDVRYNVIQWVHRSTRGWSYGSSITDPRTGEIIKGHVTLDSLRVRQDYLIAEGRLAPYGSGNGLISERDPVLSMSLARLRQLSAHEIGHTLGIVHNFAASTTNRASVMDYPAPLITLGSDGLPRLDQAYATGIGEWDKVAIRFGYSEFPAGTDDRVAGIEILNAAEKRGLRYLSDQDARPVNAAQPLANLWDNGPDPLDGLKTEMAVRKVALARFGTANIRPGRPLALMEDVLVPLYLGHRYQAVGASKMLGGLDYSYNLRSEKAQPLKAVPGAAQRAALTALITTVSPEALRLPASVRTLLPPRPLGYPQTRELFDGYTGSVFDVYAPAEVASGMVFSLIAEPERAARLAYQQDFDPTLPDLGEVLTRVTAAVWQSPPVQDRYDAALQRIAQQSWMDALLDLASAPKNAPAVRATVYQHLDGLGSWLGRNAGTDPATQAHRRLLHRDLQQFLAREYEPKKKETDLTVPPGEPIGQGEAIEGRTLRRRTREALLQPLVGEPE